EAAFHRPQDAVGMMLVPFEIKDRIHHVLEHSRTCDLTFLRHMADDECSDIAAFRNVHETLGAFTHLCDTARRTCDVRMEDGLDGVYDEEIRFGVLDFIVDMEEIRFAVYVQVVARFKQPVRTQFYLLE